MKSQKDNISKKKGMPNRRPTVVNEKKVIMQVMRLAEPLCEAEGIDLVHVEYQRESSGRILRLYIDKLGGVTLDDCVNISRQMGDLLDVNLDDKIGPYSLEVTSPGADRPLGKRDDFEKFKGQQVRIKTAQPVNGQKNFRGILLGIFEGRVGLQIGEKTLTFPLEDITKARLVNYNGEN